MRAPVDVEKFQLGTMASNNLHGGVVNVLHARHIDMKKPGISQQEKVDGRPLNLATFDTEVLEIPALLIRHSCPQAQPLVSQLDATTQVEILDECTGFEHDLDQCIRGDLLVIGLAVETGP